MKQYKIGVDWPFSLAAALVLVWHALAALGNAWWAWGLPGAGRWTMCLGLALLVVAYVLLDRTCRELVRDAELLLAQLDVERNAEMRHEQQSQRA